MDSSLQRTLRRSILSIGMITAGAVSTFVSAGEQRELEEVVVTGSYIKGSATDAASPVSVLSREDMTVAKPILMSDIIKNLGINSGSTTNADMNAENGSIIGKGNVNLRGLGVNSTLVLVNGKRMTNAAARTGRGETFVDINELPVIMIGRTEILKDGGSALYGSDAVAGVINFITRDNFEGFEASVTYQAIDNSDQDEQVVDAIWGWGNDAGTFKFVIGGEYVQRDTLWLKDKDVVTEKNRNTDLASADMGILLSSPTNPGWVNPLLSDFSTGDIKFTDPGCGVSGQDSFTGTVETPADPACRVDVRDYQAYVHDAERFNIMSTFSYAVNDSLEIYGEILYAESDITRPSASVMNHIGGQALQLPSGASTTHAATLGSTVSLGGWIPNANLPELGGTCPIPGFGGLKACPRDLLVFYVNPAYATQDVPNAPNNAAHGGWGDLASLDFIVGEYALDDRNQNESKTEKYMLGAKGDFTWFGGKSAFYDVSYGYSSNESERYELTIIKDNMELALNGLGGPNCTPNGISDMDLTTANNPYWASFNYFLSGVDPEYMFNNTPNVSQALTSTNQGDAADGCYFFNPYLSRHSDSEVGNSAELVDWMLEPRDQINGATTELETFDVVVSSEIGELGNTIFEGALGYQYRENTRKQTEPALRRSTISVDPNTGETIPVTNDAFYGTAITAYEKDQQVQALFGELKMAIGSNVEVQLAVRYEDYKDLDSSVDPKIGIRWQATDSLALRASWGTAFRAPNLGLLHQGSGYDGALTLDPLKHLGVRNGSCAPTEDSAELATCLALLEASGDWSNPDDLLPAEANAVFLKRGLPSPELLPEESENYNIGVIWEPAGALEGLMVKIDYFNVEYTEAIGPTPFSTSFLSEVALFNSVVAAGGDIWINPSTAGTSCTPTGNTALNCVVNPALYRIDHIDRISLNGNLGIIRGNDINLGTINTDGFEIELLYTFETGIGSFMLSNDTYYVNEYVIDDGISKIDIAGTNAATTSFARSLPDLKNTFTANWSYYGNSVTAVARYISDFEDTLFNETIDSYTTVDLRYDYSMDWKDSKPLTFSLGANDIFDEDLPGRRSQRGYDTTVFDPRGRIFYGRIAMGF